jgi:hypothetical protein
MLTAVDGGEECAARRWNRSAGPTVQGDEGLQFEPTVDGSCAMTPRYQRSARRAPGRSQRFAVLGILGTVLSLVGEGAAHAEAGGVTQQGIFPGTTTRVPCATFASTEWRSVVDVDIVGVIDTPEKLYTAPRRLDCGA